MRKFTIVFKVLGSEVRVKDVKNTLNNEKKTNKYLIDELKNLLTIKIKTITKIKGKYLIGNCIGI